MIRHWPAYMALATLALLAAAHPVAAIQHLISPGENWDRLADRLEPGDEILLLPGRHRAGTLTGVRGEPGRPIVIRGLARGERPVISGDRHGLRLRDAGHIVIENLVIEDARVGGVFISASLDDSEATAEGDHRGVRMRNVTVRCVGPRGMAHGVFLHGMDDVILDEVTVEGWGGAAFELLACRDVRFEDCRAVGRADHGQHYGLRLRGGCERVLVEDCRFEQAGQIAVSIGDASGAQTHRPPLSAADEPGSRFEARSVRVRRCVIDGALCALALRHAQSVQIMNNTIHRPRQTVLLLDAPATHPALGPCTSVSLGSNLIAWQDGDVERLAVVGPEVDTSGLLLEENLWWCDGAAIDLTALGPMPGTLAFAQITDVDPDLDADLRPTAAGAELFGAASP